MSSKGFIELLRLSEQAKLRLAGRKDSKVAWSGVAFNLGGINLIAPLGEVLEVISPLPMVQLPNTKIWMKGLANLRGRLLPVIDLAKFSNLADVSENQEAKKIIIISHGDLYTGLLVDRVFGIQHYSVEQFSGQSVQVHPSLDPYLQGYFYDTRLDRVNHVFLFSKLVQQVAFLNAAV